MPGMQPLVPFCYGEPVCVGSNISHYYDSLNKCWSIGRNKVTSKEAALVATDQLKGVTHMSVDDYCIVE